MNFSKFQISFLGRIILLLMSSFLFTYLIYAGVSIIISILVFFIILIQAYHLFRQMDKIHQYLTMFLRIIKESHDSYSLPARGTDYVFAELSLYFREISEVIKNAKIEKENQYHYLQYVIEHVGIGLMAFDDNGKVELFNNAGKKLLKVPNLLNIKTLDTLQNDFYKMINELEPGQQKTFVLTLNNELLHLSLKCSQFKMLDKKIKLVSFQNIKAELDEKELDSWQKLIRILNHEIMNSITPITTMTSSIKKSLSRDLVSEHENKNEIIAETVRGLNIIEERGKGLIEFVNKYRSLSSSIKPNIGKVRVDSIIKNVTGLLKNEIDEANILLTIHLSNEAIEIYADEKLIEQVLINLLKNSIQALQRKRGKKIIINSYEYDNHVNVEITDNGKGINKSDLENIFIPFYTTKENGSGIGLSLSRQIMRLHRGSISVNSIPNEQTTFTLTF